MAHHSGRFARTAPAYLPNFRTKTTRAWAKPGTSRSSISSSEYPCPLLAWGYLSTLGGHPMCNYCLRNEDIADLETRHDV